MRKIGWTGIVLILAFTLSSESAAAAVDKTTKFRVYQNDKLLMEFADYKAAEGYAKWYSNSRVEEIGSGQWLWNNFPRYQVYQLDVSLPDWKFARLEDAVAEASHWSYASVRDLQSTGWVWNNYPKYRVYQGEITLDGWDFTSLDAAVAEAKRWGESHIIDLATNRWVWDNIPASRKKELREGAPIYQVYQNKYTTDAWKFAYLEDAVAEALNWGNSVVVNVQNPRKTVFSNLKRFRVYQGGTYLDEYVSLDDAIGYAKLWAGSSVRLDGRTVWNSYATYTVYQNSKPIGEYFNIPDALAYAVQYSHASIRNLDGTSIWNNFRKLLFLGWNGSSAKDTIRNQASRTMGLDMDSPTWFELADAQGNLKDTSGKETADWLRKQGYEVHPLVTNQFDSDLTTHFLADPVAQDRFIKSLADRAAALQVQGINVDFESLNGKDRGAYTAFLQKLAGYAHGKGLKVSVDLPRGSVKWNHLTAFDHEKLAGIADYIVIMAYDQHYSGSTVPGPVAGLSWAEDGVKEFLSYGIPREKLIMGVPFYTREWSIDAGGHLLSNRSLQSKDIQALLSAKKIAPSWDNAFGQYKAEYTGDDGNRRIFWIENEQTARARLDIAKKYQLAGVAAWRLGQEPDDLWKSLIQLK